MPKILITGGLGFIFSHVTEYFVEKGWKVYVIDNQGIGSHAEIITPKFMMYTKHVEDCYDLIVDINPDYIVHAAAISDVDTSIKDPVDTMARNCAASLTVFEAARKCTNLKKLLYVSTDEVYGECEVPKTEEDIIFPKNPYAVSKAWGSLLRIAYDNTYSELKDKTCETRFCNVFGPRQDKRKIIAAIKDSMLNGSIVPYHNNGKGYREYIYVKNIPPVIDLILEKGDRTYNVTLNDGFRVHELFDECHFVSNKRTITENSNRPGMDMQYQMDNRRIMALGWEPLYTFEEGLKEYLNDKTI